MNLTKKDVAKIIETFLAGTGDDWAWDDFISLPLKDEGLERIRVVCNHLKDVYPPSRPGCYCNEKGFEILRQLIIELKS